MRATLASGQTFAFVRADEAYAPDKFYGVVAERPVEINSLRDGGYEITGQPGSAGFWNNYFDLDTSYDEILRNYIDTEDTKNNENDRYGAGRRFLTKCVGAFGGLRLLRQPVWEAVCEFIISANNHQKRIESIYRRLSESYGEPVEWAGAQLRSFPSAERLARANEEELRATGLGYRAGYILETAKIINKNGLPDLDRLEYEEALKYLVSLRGVGEKVADCVLLFSTAHKKAFPVDVWIERALRNYYGMSGSRHAIKLEAQRYFGDAAGIAQQFIFHGMRTKLI